MQHRRSIAIFVLLALTAAIQVTVSHSHADGACSAHHCDHDKPCSICKLSVSLHATGLTPPPAIPAPEPAHEHPTPVLVSPRLGARVHRACRAPPR